MKKCNLRRVPHLLLALIMTFSCMAPGLALAVDQPDAPPQDNAGLADEQQAPVAQDDTDAVPLVDAPWGQVVYHSNYPAASGMEQATETQDISRPESTTISVTLSDGGAFRLPGYTLTGWNTSANADGSAYALSSSYMMGGDKVEMYAQWKLRDTSDALDTPTSTAYPSGGSYDYFGESVTVSFTAPPAGSMYYTLDDTVPVVGAANTTAVARNQVAVSPAAGRPNPIVLTVVTYDGEIDTYSEAYRATFSIKLPTPVSNAGSGKYASAGTYIENFTIDRNLAGKMTIYYNMTTDGTEPADPTADSTAHTAAGIPFDLVANPVVKLKAIAIADAGSSAAGVPPSDIARFEYSVDNSMVSLREIDDSWSDAQITAKIREVISQMSLREKVDMLGGTKGNNFGTSIKNTGAAGGTYTNQKLLTYGIVPMTLSDGPAGVRMGYKATTWTSPTAIASSWDMDVMNRIAEQTGKEATYYGVDIMLSPGQNILRNPLGGRNFEYYSEDALLSGDTAKAYTEGTQSEGVGVTLKHYAANEQETNRSGGNVIVSERALFETYLKGFEIAMQAKPWSVMGSYIRLNNVYACSNEYLMVDVLRDKFGFDGFVMSDWGATNNILLSVLAQMDLTESSLSETNKMLLLNTIQAVEQAKQTGNWDGIDPAYHDLDTAALDQCVENILRVMLKTNTFKGTSDGEVGKAYDLAQREQDFYASELFEESNAIARETAAESMVLLKNSGDILPLADSSKISLITSANMKGRGGFGDNSVTATDFVARGGGSAGVYFDPTSETVVSLQDAMKDKFTLVGDVQDIQQAAGMTKTLNYTKTNERVTGISLTYGGSFSESALNASAAAMASSSADYGVMVISRQTGEGADNAYSRDEGALAGYLLTSNERAALKAYSDALHAKNKKFIVILNIGATIETAEIDQYADAVLVSWLPGQEGGHAITDVLSGAVNPSGKLTQTFTKTFSDSPSVAASLALKEQGVIRPNATYGAAGNTVETNGGWGTNPVFYDEGVLVGYRWFDTMCKTEADYNSKVAYPFGYGLSYTDFQFSDLTLSKDTFSSSNPSDTITATVKVKNTGTVAGKEVVQLYLGMEGYASEGRPMKDLRGYEKVSLAPGETKNVNFTISLDDLQYYDDAFTGVLEGNPTDGSNITYGNGKGWTVTPGSTFNVIIGDTSNNFELAKSGTTSSFFYGRTSGGGSSGGGSGSGGGTTQPGGSTTTEVTKPDGSKETTVINNDTGETTVTTKATDGSQSTVKTDKDGKVTAEVTLSANAEDKYLLPMPDVKPSTNAANAPSVTIKTDKAMTVTIPVNDKSKSVVAVLVGSDGKETIITKSVMGTDGLQVPISGQSTIKIIDNQKNFSDIPSTNWAKSAVDFVTSRELFNGTSATSFSPNEKMTRGMLVTVLWRFESKPEGGSSAFGDVSSDAYYAQAVAWASSKNIVTGTGAGFTPDGDITREALAAILYRYAGSPATTGQLDSFGDSSKVSDWAKTAMSWATEQGIISGKNGSALAPQDSATRAEVATMIQRFVG